MTHPAALPPTELEQQCVFRFLRRGGPGGQHRNKVSTAVVVEHRPTGLRAEANERRSQRENRIAALRRLRLLLAIEIRREWPAERSPTDLWQRRCVGSKIVVSTEHDDFPSLLAEALDAVAACSADAREAAGRLGCSSTQLIRFIQRDRPGAAVASHRRTAAAEIMISHNCKSGRGCNKAADCVLFPFDPHSVFRGFIWVLRFCRAAAQHWFSVADTE